MRIGIDLGGTKIEGVVMDGEARLLTRRRIATPENDYRGTVDAILGLVRALEREVGRQGLRVGVGTPGCIQPGTRVMMNCNSTCLNGQPLGDDLEAALGREVRLANDADCLAVSEARDGAGADARSVFAVILGTGVGGGILINGQLLSGPNGIAGEWGHDPLPWRRAHERPRKCWCGRSGCIETWLSGPALAHDYRVHTRLDLSAREIAGRVKEDEAARAALARYQERLGRALACVMNVLDPEVIVLGGGLSRIGSLYETVPEYWKPWVLTPGEVATRLLPAYHGDASGVRGAAWLWNDDE